jgi:hypothetical protein
MNAAKTGCESSGGYKQRHLGYKGRLSWLTNSALVFETKLGELRGLSQ